MRKFFQVHRQKHILFLFMAFSYAAFLFGQSGLDPKRQLSQYAIDKWTIEDGLPINSILGITKTDDGYMWLATYAGLTRFDGFEFKVYDELFDINSIREVYKDPTGTLWVGSNDGTLAKINGTEFEIMKIDSMLVNTVISTIIMDSKGVIWLGTGSGLAQLIDRKIKFVEEEQLKNAIIYATFIDSRGSLWVGTSGQGLFKYDQDGILQITKQNGLVNNSVRSIIEDSSGNIWVGTEGGVSILKEDKVLRSLTATDGLPHDYVNAIVEDKLGTVWLGTDNGLARLRKNKLDVLSKENGLLDNTIESLYTSDEGDLWIGTNHGGLARLKNGSFLNYGLAEGFTNEIANVVFVDSTKLYVGTDNGLNIVENHNIYGVILDGPEGINKIRDIYKDSRGDLWLATSEGLVNYENGIKKRVTVSDGLSNNRVRRIIEDKGKDLWIATAKGLNRLNVSNNKIEIFDKDSGIENEFILSLFADSYGNIWAGTNGGGIYLKQNDHFESITKKDGLASNIVFAAVEDPDRTVWIATNGGISRYKNGEIKSISKRQGILTNIIFHIVLNGKDRFWLLTDRGVVDVDRQEMNDVLDGKLKKLKNVKLYNQSEGMRSEEVTGVSVATSDSENLFVPTLKGVSILNFENNLSEDTNSPAIITKVVIDQAIVGLKNEIVIGPNQKNYEFHFTSLTFQSPEKVRFRYKLKGYDEHWLDAGDRRAAYYNHIPSGTYKFAVIASKNGSDWSKENDGLKVIKKEHFYQKKEFFIIALVMISLTIFIMYILRVRSLRNIAARLEGTVHDRTIEIKKQQLELEEVNASKDKLFSIIAHDLRGPVNSLSGLFALVKSGHLSHEEFHLLKDDMFDKMTGLKTMLDSILDWSRSQMGGLNVVPKNIELRKLVSDNFQFIAAQCAEKEILIENEIDESVVLFADPNQMSVIIRNITANAVKYCNIGDKIYVSSRNNDNSVDILIRDTGVGISEEDLPKLFGNKYFSKPGTLKETGTGLGLHLVKEFVNKNNGEIKVESILDEGTTFIISMPRPK